MKRKLFTSLSVGVFLSGMLLMGTSCSNDDYLKDYEIQKMIDESLNGQWKIINITVKKGDWQWDDKVRQYQAIYDLPQLTKSIYEEGAVLGYLFLGQQGDDEVQKPLPFVNTYSAEIDEAGNPIATFTETISYDVQYKDNGKSTVAFIIKDSQLAKDLDAPQNYNFRIVLIW